METLPVFVVPSNPRRVVRLSNGRLSRFVAHLQSTIDQALEIWEGPQREEFLNEIPHTAPEDDQNLPILGQGCATCRGECCLQGGDEFAFLTVSTILRFLRENPDTLSEEILETYLSRMPQASFDESCVYHTESGCNLPRELRADICNTFFCESLTRMREQLAQSPSETAYAVSISQQRISVAVCDQKIKRVHLISDHTSQLVADEAQISE